MGDDWIMNRANVASYESTLQSNEKSPCRWFNAAVGRLWYSRSKRSDCSWHGSFEQGSLTIPCTWMGVGMGVGVDVLYVVVFPKAATFIS